MKIKCVAVDDEPLALNMVAAFIEQTPALELVAKFDNGIDALHFVQSNAVQLLFLDIQMADLTGMQLARILSSENSVSKPLIVFTTAYSEFALQGYQVDAIDYLLKPFDYEDFLRACGRAQNRLESNSPLQHTHSISDSQDNIFVKVGSQIIRLDISKILYIEGFKDYIKIYVSSNAAPIVSLMNLKKIEDQLANKGFLRIHRSYIISFARVDALLKQHVKVGNKVIPVGSSYKDVYNTFLHQWIK